MAKRKRSAKRPQPQHRKKRQPSQHDRRARLARRNPRRRATTRAKFPLVGVLRTAVMALQAVLHPRTAMRLGIIVAGMMLADDRRTASSWFAAAGVLDDWDRFYGALISLGRQTEKLATVVLRLVVQKFDPGPNGRILLGVDDTPSQRYGRCVEGAGVHHNPTPGPADGEWLYGHNWVVLSWLQRHPLWGVIALPLRSLLYVREIDVPKLDAKRDWKFRTKHELAVELVRWCVATLRGWGVLAKVWLVADGAYAARPVLQPLLALGVVVVSRLRKDARLFDLPPARRPGQRGQPRKYGPNRISLTKRAAHPQGWSSITYDCRGVQVTRQYKTFLATSRLVGGLLRVVLLRHPDGWIPYFCTNPDASVQDLLVAAAARWAMEEEFHDVKEVWGAGQQQVRNVWSNIGCWHLNHWLFALVELCTWDRPQPALSDRSDRPWDNPHRRPSHADRRRSLAREILQKELSTVLAAAPDLQQIQPLLERLISLAL
jgi:hypothetical protein